MSLLDNLNDAQKHAVTHGNGPLLIVAGAGTGKTTVLTKRYAYLLEHEKCSTDQILALTFTEKAAAEMEDRVLQLLPTGTYDFWISTFHGFCQRILEAHGLEIGLPNTFRILTPTDAWLLLKRHINELPLDHYRPLGNPVKFLRSLLQHISRAKDEGILPETYLSFVQDLVLDGDTDVVMGEKKRLQELADLYAAYRKILLDEGCLDFGDLILETLRLFRERPAVLEKYRKQFRYIMVDEFQDTNGAQYELIKLLAGSTKNLTVVGDDDQAIYKFRGASLANILQFRDDFPDTKTIFLTHNYRSRKEILDTAYGLICKNNPNRLEIKLADTGLSKELTAILGPNGCVNVIWKETIEDEADAVAESIKKQKTSNAETTWNDFAILVRSNDGAEPFVRALERIGIPFQFLALRGLYSKPPIMDVIALLSLIDRFHDSPYAWRVLSLQCYPLPAKDRAELLQYASRKGVSLWQAIIDASNGLKETNMSTDGIHIVQKLVHHINQLAETAKREPALKVIQLVLEKSGYLASIMRLPERDKVESLQWLNGFADRVKRYESNTHSPSLRGFLDELLLEIESGEEGGLDVDPNAGPDMVKIMTIHAAKGLEFKHVFVVSLVDQRFPTRARAEAIPLPDGLVHQRLSDGDYHLEEERRLFYVALTRAKETLTLTGAERYGGTRDKKPSPFFAEAGLSVLPSTIKSDASTRLRPQERMEELVDEVRTLYQLKRRFSFTQLAAFRKCPYQYKLSHIYRIPILGKYQRSFGQSIHLAFQRILELHLLRSSSSQVSLFSTTTFLPADATHQALQAGNLQPTTFGFTVSDDEALKIYEDAWIDQWYENRRDHDEYFARGKKAVNHFITECHKNVPSVLEIEKAFMLVLGQHSIKGKIDRVDKLPDGSIIVYDYKTGEAKEELKAEDREQLHLYQIALENRGLRVAKLAYIYVMDWITKEVEPLTGSDRESFLESLTERMDEITTSSFHATPSSFVCKYCDYQQVCEFRKLS